MWSRFGGALGALQRNTKGAARRPGWVCQALFPHQTCPTLYIRYVLLIAPKSKRATGSLLARLAACLSPPKLA